MEESLSRQQGMHKGWKMSEMSGGLAYQEHSSFGAWQRYQTSEACEAAKAEALANVDKMLAGDGLQIRQHLVREPWGYTDKLSPQYPQRHIFVCSFIGNEAS
jgi:hypothetical protein